MTALRTRFCFVVLLVLAYFAAPLRAQQSSPSSTSPERFVTPVRTDLPGRTVWAFATTGTGSNITTFAATDKGLFRSANGGAWAEVNVLKNQEVFAVKARRVGNTSTLLAATKKGILRSQDGGTTWASPEVTTGTVVSTSNILELKKVFDIEIVNSTWYAATEKGVFRSTNDGRSWTLLNIDRSVDNNEVRGITAEGSTIIVNLWREGLWRSTNNGGSWAKLNIAGETALIRALHAQQGTNATIWLAGSVAGNLWRSVNNGTSWQKVYSVSTDTRERGLSAITESGIDAFAGSGRLMFASTPRGIAWSINEGKKWGHTLTPSTKAVTMTYFNGRLIVGMENSLAANNANTTTAEIGGKQQTVTHDLEREQGTGDYRGGGGGSGTGSGVAASPVIISSIDPSPIYQTAVNVPLTVYGQNFGADGGPVRFGITPPGGNEQYLPPSNVTPTSFTISFPASMANVLGRYIIRVWNGRDEAAGDDYFLDVIAGNPTLTGALTSPSPAIVGQDVTLTLTGTNLNGASPFFSPAMGVSGIQTSADGTSLTATVRPSSAGNGTADVSVTKVVNGSFVNAGPLPVSVQNPAPTLTANSLSPTQVLVNRSSGFSFSGANFVQGAVVLVNGASVTPSSLSASGIGFSFTPSVGGTYNVLVQNPTPGGGTSAQTLSFTALVPPEAPTITSVTPQTTFVRGSAGEEVLSLTVAGTNFESTSRLTVAGTQYPTPPSNGSFTVNIPASALTNAGTIAVSVFTPQVLGAGGGTATGSFKVLYDAPTLGPITPTTMIAGETATLVLTGTGFAPQSQLLWNGATGTFTATYTNRTTLGASLSGSAVAQPRAVDVSIRNPQTAGEGGGTSSVVKFLILNPTPAITSITPTPVVRAAALQANVSITVQATGVVNNSVLVVDGQELPTTVGAGSLTASLPATLLNATKTLSVVVRNNAVGADIPQTQSVAVMLPVINPKPSVTNIGILPIVIGTLPRSLTLSGMNFIEGATVRVVGPGGTFTLTPSAVSAASISFSLSSTEAPRAGSYTVEVLNPAPADMGGNSGTFSFTVQNPVPTITAVTPSPLTNYETTQELTITGTGFIADATAPSTIQFSGRPLTIVPGTLTATSVRVYLPTRLTDAVGNQTVSVTSPAPGGGTATLSLKTVHPAPNVSSTSPATLEANQQGTFIINGSNFVAGATTVWLGSRQLTATVGANEFTVPGSRITVSLQASDIPLANSYALEVRTPQVLGEGGGTASATVTVVNPVPTLSSVSPTEFNLNATNRTITLTGTKFVGSAQSSVSEVRVNGGGIPTTYNSANSLSATLAASHVALAGTRTITVFNPAPQGGTSEERTITVFNPQAVISTLSPDRATLNGNDLTVTLTGTDFITGAEVLVNGTAYPASVGSSSTLTFTMPASQLQGMAGTRSVVVRNPAPSRGASAAATFTVQNPQPALSSLSQTVIPAYSDAITLTLSGTDFITGAVATWNKGTATATALGTSVTGTGVASITIPAYLLTNAGTFTITLDNPAPTVGASNSLSLIVINRVPVLTAVAPNESLVGSPLLSLTLTGDFFAVDATTPTNAAQAFWNGLPLVTTNQSRTSLTAAVPASFMTLASVASLTVKNPSYISQGGGESQSVEFTVKNPLPVLNTIAPTFVVAGASQATITLNGTSFQRISMVEVQDANGAWTLVPNTFVSPTRLTILLPASYFPQPAVLNVRVINPTPGGGTSASVSLTVRPPDPTLATLTPSTATLSTSTSSVDITLTGTGYVTTSTVRIGGVATTTTYISPTQLRITLSRPAGTYILSVNNPALNGQGGGTSENRTFTVLNGLPVLTALAPSTTSATGSAFEVVVSGQNFVPTSRVLYNGVALSAASVVYTSPTELRATFPAAPIASTTHSVRVENPQIAGTGGGTSATLNLTIIYPVPLFTSLSPLSTSATARDWTLTVRGTFFAPVSLVRVNGQTMTTEYVNNTTLRAIMPGAFTRFATYYNVQVFTPSPGGGTSATLQFSVNNPDPTLSAIAPVSVPAGTVATITLTGTNFATNATVELDGPVTTWTTITTVTVLSSTQLTVTIPGATIAQSGTYSLRVVNPTPGGGTSGSRALTVMNLVPVLTALSPSTTSATGTSFVIALSGQNFVSTSRVFYNGVQISAASVNFVSPTELLATLPSAPIASTTHFLYVQNPPVSGLGGGTSATLALTIEYPQPQLTSLSPASTTATINDWTLTVRGTLFAPVSVIRVNGQTMTTQYLNSTTLRAIIPGVFTRNAAYYTAEVVTPTAGFPSSGGGISSALTFSTNNPDPTLFSIAPTSVSAGTTANITLTGTNFATNATIELDGPAAAWTTMANAQVQVVSATEITLTLPGSLIEQSGSYYLRVVNPAPGGGISGSRLLTVNPAAAQSAEFIGITTATLTTGQADGFYIRFRDAFGNLTDTDRDVVRFTNADGSSTGTIALRRSSRGVSTATTTVFTVDGVYTFSVDNVPSMTGNRTLTVQTGTDYFTHFENIQPQITAGGTLPTFRLTYKDRFGNLTDRGLGDVTLRMTTPSNGRIFTVSMNRVSEGVYESVPFTYTTSGTFFVRVASIPLSYISYTSSTGTVVTGEAPSFRVNPTAPIVEVRNLDMNLNAGQNQAALVIVIRDIYGNDVPSPDPLRFTYTNITSATGGIRTSTATLDVSLRAGRVNVYDVPATRFEWQGAYSLEANGFTEYKGMRQFVVNALAAQAVDVVGLPTLAGLNSNVVFRLAFRDRYNNVTDAERAITITKADAPAVVYSVLQERTSIGVSTATIQGVSVEGTYTLLVGGMTVTQVFGNKNVAYLQGCDCNAKFTFYDISRASENIYPAYYAAGNPNILVNVEAQGNCSNLAQVQYTASSSSGTLGLKLETATPAMNKWLYSFRGSMTTIGDYTLSISGVNCYTYSTLSMPNAAAPTTGVPLTIRPAEAVRATIDNLRPFITPAEQLPPFTVKFFDRYGNLSDKKRVVGQSAAIIAGYTDAPGEYAALVGYAVLGTLPSVPFTMNRVREGEYQSQALAAPSPSVYQVQLFSPPTLTIPTLAGNTIFEVSPDAPALEATPTSLSFENAPLGSTPTQTYTLAYRHLRQTQITITAPPGFEVSAAGQGVAPTAFAGTLAITTTTASGTLTVTVRYLNTTERIAQNTAVNNTAQGAPPTPVNIVASTLKCQQPTVRVLFLYTKGAEVEFQKINRTPSDFVLANLSDANSSFLNSNVDLRFELAGILPINYTENDDLLMDRTFLDDRDMKRLTNPSDGEMDEAHTLRNNVSADVVVLLYFRNNTSLSGIASDVGVSEAGAFCMLNIDGNKLLIAPRTLAHEIGHLFGARHDNDPTLIPFAFGHGYSVSGQYRTIMAVSNSSIPSQQLNYWSSPVPLPDGRIIGNSSFNNDAAVMRERAPVVEGFRPAVLSVLIDGPNSLPFGERGTWQAVLPSSYCLRNDVSYQWFYGVYSAQGQLSWVPFGPNRPTATQRMGLTRAEIASSEPTFVYLRVIVNVGSEQAESYFWADCSDCQAPVLAAAKQESSSSVNSWGLETPIPQTLLTEEFVKLRQPCFLETFYPNPAQDASTLRWHIPTDTEVSLTVYDMLRRPVLKPMTEIQTAAGTHETTLNLRNLPSGNYIVMLRAGGHLCTKIISVIH